MVPMTLLSRSRILSVLAALSLVAIAVIIVGQPSSNDSDAGHEVHRRTMDKYPDGMFAMSAFDTNLYKSMLQEPYVSYPCVPSMVHIVQADNVDAMTGKVGMIVSFSLDRTACAHVTPTIVYGRGGQTEGEQIASPEDRVSFEFQSDFTGFTGDQKYQSDWIFHMHLPDLQAGMELYWYQIIALSPSHLANKRWMLRVQYQRYGESPKYELRTPPLPGIGPTNLALVGDVGQNENSTKTFNHILSAVSQVSNPVSMLLLAGDLSYADSNPHLWGDWLKLMEPLLRSTSMITVPGNHEIECDSSTQEIFTAYEHFFRNPNRIAPADRWPIDLTRCADHQSSDGGLLAHYDYGNGFYSVIHGLAHIISLNSYTDSSLASVQYQWLISALQKVDRAVTPWVIVQFHNPIYTTFTSHQGEENSQMMKQYMEPLFVEGKVNIVLAGHDHAYMRTQHIINGVVDSTERSPIYLTIGSGGAGEKYGTHFIHDVPEDWIAKRDNVKYGYGNLFLANATHAHFQWISYGTSMDGVTDDYWLPNQHVGV